ncbi:MAG TPA: hypothetical protein VFH48_07350 [Chloroflexota bacterium]|nr:hypothetical protein [Chloroflexota bacterium]
MRTLTALALSALLLTGSATAAFADETSSIVRSTTPGTERFNDGDGSGMTVPTAPGVESDYERWA